MGRVVVMGSGYASQEAEEKAAARNRRRLEELDWCDRRGALSQRIAAAKIAVVRDTVLDRDSVYGGREAIEITALTEGVEIAVAGGHCDEDHGTCLPLVLNLSENDFEGAQP